MSGNTSGMMPVRVVQPMSLTPGREENTCGSVPAHGLNSRASCLLVADPFSSWPATRTHQGKRYFWHWVMLSWTLNTWIHFQRWLLVFPKVFIAYRRNALFASWDDEADNLRKTGLETSIGLAPFSQSQEIWSSMVALYGQEVSCLQDGENFTPCNPLNYWEHRGFGGKADLWIGWPITFCFLIECLLSQQ